MNNSFKLLKSFFNRLFPASLLAVFLIVLAAGCGDPFATKVHSSRPAIRITNLVEHVFAQLAGRTNGASGNFVWIPDNQVVTPDNLHLDPGFFLRDVTNILAASQTEISEGWSFSCANYLTAISPRFCISAAHTVNRNSDGYNGHKMLWLLPGGAFYTNAAIAGLVISNADLIVCLMANTNPLFCRVLPAVANLVPALKHGQSPQNLPLPAVLFRGGDGLPEPHTAFVLSLASDGSRARRLTARSPAVLFLAAMKDMTVGLAGTVHHRHL